MCLCGRSKTRPEVHDKFLYRHPPSSKDVKSREALTAGLYAAEAARVSGGNMRVKRCTATTSRGDRRERAPNGHGKNAICAFVTTLQLTNARRFG